jgi:hypothetical protein
MDNLAYQNFVDNVASKYEDCDVDQVVNKAITWLREMHGDYDDQMDTLMHVRMFLDVIEYKLEQEQEELDDI